MPEPTYRIAQRLHERRAAKGLATYGRHLDADSQGCMLVHALEENADKTNYLIAEIQRRRELMKWLKIISDEGEKWSDWAHGWFVDLGGDSALAQHDEILCGAEADTDPRDEALRVAAEALESCKWNVTNHADGHQMQFQLCAEKARQALAAIRAELAAAKNLLARIHRDGGHYTEAVGFAQSVADADLKVSEWLLAAEERTALAAHDAAVKVAVLREVANKFEATEIDSETREPSESYDCGFKDGQYSAVNWLIAEADRNAKEGGRG